MSEENKNVVRRWIEEFWNNHHVSIANEILTPDNRNHDPANPDVGNGPEAHVKLHSIYATALPDLHFHIEDMIAEADRVVARWTMTGTHNGDLQGIQPTGKKVNLNGTSICRIANGKIAEQWVNWDALGLMQQIGVVPKTDRLKQAA